MKIVGIIPARLKSTRMPEKLLRNDTGKPLIQHTYESVLTSKMLDRVFIASDCFYMDNTIYKFAQSAQQITPLIGLKCGTERVAYVAKRNLRLGPDDIVVNIQGDEPEVRGEDIDNLIKEFLKHRKHPWVMATLCSEFESGSKDCESENVVKVFKSVAQPDVALRFYRYAHNPIERQQPFRHVGVYIYRNAFLQKFVEWEQSESEKKYNLEQLRAMDRGVSIGLVQTQTPYHNGIDTEADYLAFCARMREKAND